MVYSPSQLDAAGDVDPVAEADVYLAYGRDLQAEEILKEAMRTTPQRVAIHSKLLEIYAKRRDAKAFELVATEAYSLTRGEGPEWEHICELGQELDPSNSLYRPAASPPRAPPRLRRQRRLRLLRASARRCRPRRCRPPRRPPRDLDLDLDFSLGDDEPAAPAPTPLPATQPHREPRRGRSPCPAWTWTSARPRSRWNRRRARMPRQPHTRPGQPRCADLTRAGNSLSFDAPAMRRAARPRRAPAADAGMIEFDLGALSLDLDTPAPQPPAPRAGRRTRRRRGAGEHRRVRR